MRQKVTMTIVFTLLLQPLLASAQSMPAFNGPANYKEGPGQLTLPPNLTLSLGDSIDRRNPAHVLEHIGSRYTLRPLNVGKQKQATLQDVQFRQCFAVSLEEMDSELRGGGRLGLAFGPWSLSASTELSKARTLIRRSLVSWYELSLTETLKRVELQLSAELINDVQRWSRRPNGLSTLYQVIGTDYVNGVVTGGRLRVFELTTFEDQRTKERIVAQLRSKGFLGLSSKTKADFSKVLKQSKTKFKQTYRLEAQGFTIRRGVDLAKIVAAISHLGRLARNQSTLADKAPIVLKSLFTYQRGVVLKVQLRPWLRHPDVRKIFGKYPDSDIDQLIYRSFGILRKLGVQLEMRIDQVTGLLEETKRFPEHFRKNAQSSLAGELQRLIEVKPVLEQKYRDLQRAESKTAAAIQKSFQNKMLSQIYAHDLIPLIYSKKASFAAIKPFYIAGTRGPGRNKKYSFNVSFVPNFRIHTPGLVHSVNIDLEHPNWIHGKRSKQFDINSETAKTISGTDEISQLPWLFGSLSKGSFRWNCESNSEQFNRNFLANLNHTLQRSSKSKHDLSSLCLKLKVTLNSQSWDKKSASLITKSYTSIVQGRFNSQEFFVQGLLMRGKALGLNSYWETLWN